MAKLKDFSLSNHTRGQLTLFLLGTKPKDGMVNTEWIVKLIMMVSIMVGYVNLSDGECSLDHMATSPDHGEVLNLFCKILKDTSLEGHEEEVWEVCTQLRFCDSFQAMVVYIVDALEDPSISTNIFIELLTQRDFFYHSDEVPDLRDNLYCPKFGVDCDNHVRDWFFDPCEECLTRKKQLKLKDSPRS